ncbi:MAG: UDP-N-acetylglucosamine--LPS N-acetylglucosamine transferase [Candidatus Electrothrix sp. LOE1_4_5]|nr:UDP-N-acetylglucosamine--LPS N-acetylglucosamine transferase [Candidatus Electrothrix gigas]
MKKILMVASAGGHWVQLNRLRSAVEGQHLIYVATNPELAQQNKNDSFFTVPDASRWDKMRIFLLALRTLWIIIRIRPDIVISTGALPGFFAIFFGKMLGARTVWIDSIANSDKLSLSGQKAGKYSDLWLTQWEHLARPEGPHYHGTVI